MRTFDWVDFTGLEVDAFAFEPAPTTFGPKPLYHSPVKTWRQHRASQAAAKTTSNSCNALIYKEISPLSRGSVEIEVFKRSRHSIYDLDDASFLDREGGLVRSHLLSRSAKTELLVQSCQRVIAGNEYIAEWARDKCSDVRIIPSCVDPNRYEAKTCYDIDGPPRAVWIGSFSTEKYLIAIAPALRRLHTKIGLTIDVISSPGEDIEQLNGIMRRIPWSEEVAFRSLHTYDVGVMPLPDAPYERGKCGYKLLQYGAARLPAVGSPVGVNRRILKLYGAAAPSSARDYYDALEQLLTAPGHERSLLAARSHRVVLEHFSFQSWKDAWLTDVTQ